jgi:hypothetical protein
MHPGNQCILEINASWKSMHPGNQCIPEINASRKSTDFREFLMAKHHTKREKEIDHL